MICRSCIEPCVRTDRSDGFTHGNTVHEAEDGFQTLDLIRRSALRIELMVTDLVMPGMNGKGAKGLCRHASKPMVCMCLQQDITPQGAQTGRQQHVKRRRIRHGT